MFFTNIARVLAVLIILAGILTAIGAFFLPELGLIPENSPADAVAKNVSKLVYHSMIVIVVGVALGVLSEISRGLNRPE